MSDPRRRPAKPARASRPPRGPRTTEAPAGTPAPAPDLTAERARLRADCANCFALCCVALPFTRSADFPVSKQAGAPCGNLREDFRCGIHTRLRDEGYRGCTVFDCFGAGQRVSRETFDGRDWRTHPDLAPRVFETFPIMRQVHELLFHLTECLALPAARPHHRALRELRDRVETAAGGSPDALRVLNLPALRAEVGALLGAVSELVRGRHPAPRRDHRGADLMGARLRGTDLRGASLRGAYLIGADLSGADLRGADLLGADLRDADLRGADLRESLFLAPSQLNAARGDTRTRVPEHLPRPEHWR
ncbi:pentapeptide repeat-containing protein [Streptomyces sp. BI20]|uniref:pentapeptide repeat-containing protein n=1 Tax=Streptomyces sp. BI20 TaxID=3403460 RepID=UPI003C7192F6